MNKPFPYEDEVAGYLDEWRRFRRGEGVTLQSASMVFDESLAIEKESRRDERRAPPTIAASASRTAAALALLESTSGEQHDALLMYHGYSTNAITIARRVGCDRHRVPTILKCAHENFIAHRISS